jgi:hypothetical protein
MTLSKLNFQGFHRANAEMVEQLRAETQVALHIGDASGLSNEAQRQSYEVNGQIYLYLSWK